MKFDYIEQGDCLELMKDIPDESIDLVVTDPPYKIVSGGCTTKKNATSGVLNNSKKEVKSGKLFEHNELDFKDWLLEIYRILKPNTHCYIMINGRNLAELQYASEEVGFAYQNLLVWDKGNVTPNKWYMNRCEFILMLRKGKAKNIKNMGSTTLIAVKNIIGKKVHPTEKPTELLEFLITNSSNENDIILDPFMDSGSTCVAAVNTNRHYIGFELDDKYFDIACKRLDEVEERMDKMGRPLDKCLVFFCEKRKLQICCRSCDGFAKCKIRCENHPDECNSFEKIFE
jgi:site-specific DNA-methyltransferase (adenine-specific)